MIMDRSKLGANLTSKGLIVKLLVAVVSVVAGELALPMQTISSLFM